MIFIVCLHNESLRILLISKIKIISRLKSPGVYILLLTQTLYCFVAHRNATEAIIR